MGFVGSGFGGRKMTIAHVLALAFLIAVATAISTARAYRRVQERAARDRRQAEKELTQNAAQKRLLLGAINEACVVTDDTGSVNAWNRSAERTFGWAAEEAMGRWLPELIIPPEDRPDFENLLART